MSYLSANLFSFSWNNSFPSVFCGLVIIIWFQNIIDCALLTRPSRHYRSQCFSLSLDLDLRFQGLQHAAEFVEWSTKLMRIGSSSTSNPDFVHHSTQWSRPSRTMISYTPGTVSVSSHICPASTLPRTDTEYSLLALQSLSTGSPTSRRLVSTVAISCNRLISKIMISSFSGFACFFPKTCRKDSCCTFDTTCRSKMGFVSNFARQLWRCSGRRYRSSRTTVVMWVRFLCFTLASHRAQSSGHRCSYVETIASPRIDRRHVFRPTPWIATSASPWYFSNKSSIFFFGITARPCSTTGRRNAVKIILRVRNPKPGPME